MTKTGRTGHRRERRGLVLVVVLLLVVLLGAMALARSLRSTSVTSTVDRDATGDEALDLAASALTEAHFRLSHLVDDPDGGGEAFSRFRQETGAFRLSLGLASLPGLKGLLGQSRGYALEGASVLAEVLFQSAASPALPQQYDRYGSVRLTARVRHERTKAVRTLSQTYDFRTNLTTTPRYFDTYTFFVRDPSELLHASSRDGDPNVTIRWAMDLLEKLRGEVADVATRLREIQQKLQEEGAPGGDVIEEVLQLLQGLEQSWPEVRVLQAGAETSSDPGAVHLFPPPPLMYYTHAPKVDLAALNLPDRVAQRFTALDGQAACYDRARQALGQTVAAATSAEDLERIREQSQAYVASVRDLAAGLRDLLLLDYKGFQDSLLEAVGGTATALEQFCGQLSMNDMLAKASAQVTEGRAGDAGEVNSRLEDLLARGPSLHGLVVIRNPTQELLLDRTFRGRMVLAVEGNVTLRRVAVEDPAQDMVTIVCFGRMELQGPAQASLVPFGTFTSTPEAAVTGNLIANRISFAGTRPAEVLVGTVTRDERVVAGPVEGDLAPWPDYEYVTLGPEPVFVDIVRR